MKLLQQPDPIPGQFEGRTPEEAVRLARDVLGNEAPVRCWKARSGGVLGFFARETFVAGTKPPPGAVKTVKTARPLRASVAPKDAPPDPIPSPSPVPSLESSAGEPPESSLSRLIEQARDEVTLGTDGVPAAVFSEVLAQAQAVVRGSDVPMALPTDPVASIGTEKFDGLIDSLMAVGVPPEYRPDPSAATLDGLTAALVHLPRPEPMPTRGGSVIMVIGSGRDAHAAAHVVLRTLGLEPADLVDVAPTEAGRRQVARRRSAKKVTVLVVKASLGSRELSDVMTWIHRVQPDYALGAVPATAKRADVAHWSEQLGHLDAVALSGLASTATPADLMGTLPIALLDGFEATTLRWVQTLLTATLERAR